MEYFIEICFIENSNPPIIHHIGRYEIADLKTFETFKLIFQNSATYDLTFNASTPGHPIGILNFDNTCDLDFNFDNRFRIIVNDASKLEVFTANNWRSFVVSEEQILQWVASNLEE